ncbi:O-antigen ligase [Erythrobacter sp. YT30]|uniref:O-antigen ligase family protein n=1 Tax=Erythrobacter sp. YT30 TaxID=1735012 RepID=UPI00076C1E88|nr:O-antigen ligase family protein [Erythrobacter sp. YT30]KWV91362.1 hypothetical protein AUC45_08810 [Erythrobacter sp. YT30]
MRSKKRNQGSFETTEKQLKRGDTVALVAIAVFALVVAFLGGASRSDAVQIVALRPLSALFLIPPLVFFGVQKWHHARVPILLFAGLVTLMAVQLIPLPPSLWQTLPARDTIADLDALIGQQALWRPVSMVPSRTLGALASLIVPGAAMLILLTRRVSLRNLYIVIVAIGVVDAGFGIAQIITGTQSPFYLYSVTNRGAPVGLFANQNHSAVFSCLVLLICARLILEPTYRRELPWLPGVGVATLLLLLVAIIISGSRSGLAAGLGALAACVVMSYAAFSKAAKSAKQKSKAKQTKRGSKLGTFASDPRKLLVALVVAIIVLVALFVLNGRAEIIESVLSQNALEDIRWKIWPVLAQMLSAHWLVGSGFGSFEEVYHIYEPRSLLLPSYLNQAHNDWAQFAIEGGLAAVSMLVIFIAWVARSIISIAGAMDRPVVTIVFWLSVFGIIAVASIVDYPLRAPLFQVIGVWLVLSLAIERANGADVTQRPSFLEND